MIKSRTIRLFWWSELKLMNKPKENYGDVLGKYLVEKISNKKVHWAHPKKFHIFDLWRPIYVTIGSVLAHVNKKCVVWGSGIIQDNQIVKPATFLAVRGPETHRVLSNQGYKVPKVYGDPALLLPDYYSPTVSKMYDYGVIPHYVDYKLAKQQFGHLKNVLVIDLMTNDVEITTNQILQCKKIMSSSLHGIIVSHAYQIPAIWIKFSNKLFGDDIKFKDYFKSVLIEPYQPCIDEPASNENFKDLFKKEIELPNLSQINKLKIGLMKACPF
ncbi:polysaccharide pyruvyl transferase family protein [uncultured Algibacter sp.]|uniref:polysaccharide pyruvyl transferase family protein n=1 Tax=uncultured Algibacter sp. TaxID=298659 RepID=UPI003217339D